MIDDRTESTHLIDEPEFNLPPPRFDESATAHAQRVQPLRASKVSALHHRVASLLYVIKSRSRGFVLVVIAGLVTGTWGGMTLVKEHAMKEEPVTQASAPASESVSELAPAASQNEGPRAEVLGLTDLEPANPTATRIRRSHSRVRASRAPRAYRVAVLR